MPPESFHWDRKDLSKGRKRERSVDPVGHASRWRDSPRHGTNSPRDFNRWGNNGGYRNRASGHCKQGGLHRYPEQPNYGLYPFPPSDGMGSPCRQNDRMTPSYYPNERMTSPLRPNDRLNPLYRSNDRGTPSYRSNDRIHTPCRPTDSSYRSTPQRFNDYANTPQRSNDLHRSNDYWVGGTQYPYIDKVDTPRTYIDRARTPHHSIDRVGTPRASIDRARTPHHSGYAVASPHPSFDRGTDTPRRSSERGTPSFLPSETVASPSRPSEKIASPPRYSQKIASPSRSSEKIASPSRSSEKIASPFCSNEMGTIPFLSSENIASPYCSSDKIVDGETGRSSETAVDGRCNRNCSGSTQDLETHPLENGGVTDGSGKPPNISAQMLVDDMPTDNSLPRSDLGNAKDEQHDKIDSVSALGTDQRLERGGSLGSVDWKSHRWTRRSSSFLQLSGSKSFGADSSEGKAEAQDKIVNPVETQSGDPSACVQLASLSEETNSRKKPRVRWGEGLAKYEKKKVDVFDDGATNNEGVDCFSVETSCSDLANLADKSPGFTSFPGFASPTTPSSVDYSSSPGIEKRFLDTSTTDNATSRNSGSQDFPPSDIVGAEDFDLESLDSTSIANLSSSLSKLVQFDSPTSEDSSFVRATSLNKLLVWKGSITKALEMTESEIDSLENELKSFVPDTGISSACPVASSSLPGNAEVKTSECQAVGPDSISQVDGLQIVSSVNLTVKEQGNDMEEVPDPLGGDGADSPGTVTSKLLGPLPSKDDVLFDRVKYNNCSVDLDAITSITLEPEAPICSSEAPIDMNVHGDGGPKSLDLIFTSNKESAARAFSDLLNNQLPSNQCGAAVSRNSSVSDWSNGSLIKEKILARKKRLNFKERVYTMKFMVFRRLWREDMRLLSVRKNRAKSQKRLDSSFQTLRGSSQKHRSSARSRFSPGGNSSVVPSAEVINFTSKLLSGSQFKLRRKVLRMPAMVLDKKEKMALQFVSNNGLVEDPCAVEKERAFINPWTTEEKEIFMDKLVALGKDFRKIASFLDHKTTADCVEFYYKNHKSDSFRKAKKIPKIAGQGESSAAHNYLVTSEKRWNREAGAASLDMLGAVSAVAANPGDGAKNPKNCESSFLLAAASNYRAPQHNDDSTERLDNFDALDSDRETVAVGVLAGICGSLSSEAMSSCITSSVDPVESHQDSKSQKVVSSMRRPLTPEAVNDGSCSDDSCDEMYSADWTDEEKVLFVQALTAHGKDFAMISKCMKTKSESLCSAFFTKTRRPLGLDNICSSSGKDKVPVSDGAGCGGSDSEGACGLLNGSVICSEKSETKLDDGLVSAHKMDADINNCSEVDEDAVSRPNAEELMKVGPDMDNGMVEVNLDTLESNPADTINALPGRDRSEDDPRAGKTEVEIPELEEERAIADVSIGESNKELNSVGICPLLAPSHNSSEDCDTGLGFAVEQPVACEVSADHNLTVSATEGETIVSKDSTACLVNDLEKKQLQSENINVGSTVFASLPEDRPDQDIVSNSLVEHPEKMQLTGLDLLPSSGSLSSSFGLDVSLAKGNSTTDTSPSSHCERTHEQGAHSTVGFEKQTSARAVSPCLESSLLPAAQFIPVTATGNEMSGNICSKNAEVDGNAHTGLNLLKGSFLQKCNSLEAHSSATQFPFLPLDKRSDHGKTVASDVGRPCKSGDVKLFGKILTTTTTTISEPSNCNGVRENNHGGNQVADWRSGGLNMRSRARSADANSVPPESENASLRSYGFWDGNRAKTNGIATTLPDSSILLAKYPAAFSNFSPSSFPNAQSGNGQYFGGSAELPLYQNWENAGNGVPPPFNFDIGQRQDVVFPEVKVLLPERLRRNNANSNQQQGVLSGQPMNGNVGDPVAAIRLGYAAAAMERMEAKRRSATEARRT